MTGTVRTTSIRSVFLRTGLAVLFLDELVVGGWNAMAPWSFYRTFPTVDLTPPFSEHYARDFGGATLGLAVLLGIALARPRPHFVIPAVSAFLVFAVPHFFFHLTHLHTASRAEAVALTLANAGVVLLGAAVLVVSGHEATAARRRQPERDQNRPGGADD